MNFTELKEAVLKKTPKLKEILATQTTTPLAEYFQKSLTYISSYPKARQQELLFVIEKMIKKYIGQDVATDAVQQLQKYYYASTADHHGPITHPFFVNSHLAQSIAHKTKGLRNVFVFSCGGISLNNSSFPRGFFFHDAALNKNRLRLTSLKYKHQPVYSFPAYTREEIDARLTEELQHLPETEIHILQPLVEKIYKDPTIFSHQWYSEQITKTNYTLWKHVPGQENTNLIYLEQESIVREVLLAHHLNDTTLLHKLLTTEEYLSAFEQCFTNIRGAHFDDMEKGTVLFWAIHNNKRKQLRREGTTLKSLDGSYIIELTPENIRKALTKKELMPSMALSFIVLSFYYGLTCGGGFLQVNYLTEMKTAYITFLQKIHALSEIELVSTITTDFFCGEFVFATMKNSKRTAHASSIDLILYGNAETAQRLQELAKLCTLGNAIDAMMPEFYKILYGIEPIVEQAPLEAIPVLYV